MKERLKRANPALLLFFLLISAAALGNGLSDSIYSNYFKEVYQIDAMQRGFLEFPRELPGLLCTIIIGMLAFMGDLRIAVLAQIAAFAGLLMLGLITPPFAVMCVFLFVNSTGMHLFMPLQDSIGMALAEPDRVGKRLGQYASVRSAIGFLAGLLVFFGFRSGFFSFQAPIKAVFLAGAGAFLLAILISLALVGTATPAGRSPMLRPRFRLVFRKQYKYYYMLTILHGVQKQIAYVYGSWVIIDLLLKGADTMALLGLISSFISIFFMQFIGKWMDKFGIKRMMYIDAITFIVVYILYGFVVWGIAENAFPSAGTSALIVYALFILDRLSMQIGIVKSLYMRSIAWDVEDVTATLSTGTSLDHIVSIIAASVSGYIWMHWGSHWVFFIAAFLSLGNLLVAYRVKPDEEQELALAMRAQKAAAPGA